MKVIISYLGILFDLIKTLDEFDDEGSGTPVRALKTLTLKNLVKTIGSLRSPIFPDVSVYVPVPKPTLHLRSIFLQNEFKIITYRTEYIVNNSPI